MGMSATARPTATRRFTADEVWQMLRIGLLGEDEPYELLDGELQYVSPADPAHAKVVNRVAMAFFAHYGPLGHVVRVQQPLSGIHDAIPEPDVAVVPRDVEEGEAHPRPGQAVLLVEVAHTSLRRDQRKASIYAAAGAPEYWIVDVDRRVVAIHRGPRSDGTWDSVVEAGLDAEVSMPGTAATLPVAAVLTQP